MSKSAMFLFLLLAPIALSQQVRVPEGAWLQDDIKWSKAPREYNPKLRVARSTIAYFGGDHTFALIYATVNRVPNEYEVISNGDGQVVYLGTWSVRERTIALTYGLISRTVQMQGEQLPGPTINETAKQSGSAIVLVGHSFRRSSALDQSMREYATSKSKR
jgi:hypothetical protein